MIKCIHGLPIEMIETMGVTEFIHTDTQSYCGIYNEFGVTTDTMLHVQYTGLHIHDIKQRTILLISRSARLQVYRELSLTKSSEDLRHALELLLYLYGSAGILTTKLFKEMVSIFKLPLRHNFKILGRGDLAFLQENVRESIEFPMIKLEGETSSELDFEMLSKHTF